MKTIAEKLKASGLKVTQQRMAIFKTLTLTKEHPSAETIYKVLSGEYPSMSLATVYKTMYTLKVAGLVKEINTGEDYFRYDANVEPHPHATCNVCHKVVDIEGIEVPAGIRAQAEEKSGFSLNEERVYFFGVCAECKAALPLNAG